ncbi:MAG: phosphoglycerate mutase, partial [Chloroflexi bacterium]|nr:phosphoglycerate mutase [Chloroflexota bacterium]
VRMLEDFDRYLPKIRALNPDVLMIGGDHSTPSLLAAHSWHPVPFLLHSKYSGRDGIAEFSERACARGSLGRFPAQQALHLAMANALKLTKYGA